MIPKLTKEMCDALQDKSCQPVLVEDESTRDRYVLLPLNVYQRVASIVGDEFSIAETYAAQDEALARLWDDPELDIYNLPDPNQPS